MPEAAQPIDGFSAQSRNPGIVGARYCVFVADICIRHRTTCRGFSRGTAQRPRMRRASTADPRMSSPDGGNPFYICERHLRALVRGQCHEVPDQRE